MHLGFSKKNLVILFFALMIGLFFQNCAKKLISSSAQLIEEAEIQSTYAVANIDFIDINQDKMLYSTTSTVLTVFPLSKDTNEFTYQWKRNGEVLPGQTAKDLVLSNLETKDSAQYSVMVKTVLAAEQKLRSAETELKIANLVIEPQPVISTAVEITEQSPSLKIESGVATYLQVKHRSYPTASVQWFKDSMPLPGSTSDHLLLTEVTNESEGIYYAEISNLVGKVRSQEILVLVNSPLAAPLLRRSAEDQNLALGQPLDLFIEALAAEKISYQWFKDGVLIPDQKSNQLRIRNTINTDEGNYKVVAQTASGVTEHEFNVTVFDQINIQQPLLNQNAVAVGSTVSFSTNLSGDISEIEWFKDGVKIPNQSQLQLVLTNVQVSSEGTYKVVAKNPYGHVSQNSTLTVVRPPKIISAVAGRNTLYATESDANAILTLAAGIEGDSLQYQWSFKGNSASAFAPIKGATSSVYTKTPLTEADSGEYQLVASNISGSVNTSLKIKVINTVKITQGLVSNKIAIATPHRLSIQASASASVYKWFANSTEITSATAAEYDFNSTVAGDFVIRVEVTDLLGGKDSSTATFSVLEKPKISSGPYDYSKYAGEAISLSCIATGVDLKYQWYKNEVAIVGATTKDYSLSNPQTSDSGTYKVVVSNISGSASDSAVVTIKPASPPVINAISDQTVFEGTRISFYATATGSSTFEYTWHKDDVLLSASTGSSLVFDPAKLSDTATYKVTVKNSVGTATEKFYLTVNPQILPVINSQSASVASYYVGSAVNMSLSAVGGYLTYKWFKNDVLIAGATSSNYYISSSKLTDAAIYSAEVSNSKGTVKVKYDIRVVDFATPTLKVGLADQAVYINDPAYLSIQVDGGGLSYKWYKDDVVISGVTSASYYPRISSVADAGVYKVEVSNSKGVLTSTAVVTIRQPGGPAVTLTGNTTIWEGDTLLVSTTSSGENITYEWFKDGKKLNVTSKSFQLVNTDGSSRTAVVADSGEYKVVATNSVGVATAKINLTVKPATKPKITNLIFDYSFKVGDSVYISTTAEGGGLKYKWYKDSVLLKTTYPYFTCADDTDSSSTNFTALSAGVYRVEVSNSLGTTTANFTLSVRP